MKRIFTDISNFDDEEDSDDNEEKKNKQIFQQKTKAVIYLIDARDKMFSPSFEEDKIPFLRCLECVRNTIRNDIFRVQKCYCSIILLGTKKVENPLKLNNICIIQELALLGAGHVLKIDEIIKAVENSMYEKEYGHEKFSLADAFWLSSSLFQKKSESTNKTVFFFTNDDNTVSDDKNEESRAVATALDMYKNFITFELIHLGKSFDVTKFYKKIILASRNDSKYVIPDSVTNVQEMLRRVSKTNFKHVTLVKLPFVISDDFTIGVSVHFLVRKSKPPYKVKLSRSTNEKVTTKLQFFETETGSLVNEENLIKSKMVALKDINFTTSELKTISDVGKCELRLLGFKPASTLRLENYVKPCAFIYPDNSKYKGSSVFFTALMKRCIAKQFVAICTFCPRTTSNVRFVALIAQDEYLRDDKSQVLPPGFVLFFLPFAEEVRTIEDKFTRRAQPEDVEIAMKLIKKLKFNYRVESFENPRLKSHWAAIEALALDLKEPEEVVDGTVPNYDLISQRTGDIAKEFMESVYEEGYEPEQFMPPKASRPKKFKPIAVCDGNVEDLVREGKGIQVSNTALINYLKSIGDNKGLSKAKKADLIERVRKHLNLD